MSARYMAFSNRVLRFFWSRPIDLGEIQMFNLQVHTHNSAMVNGTLPVVQ